jgi:hypothetical protein
MIVSLPNGLPKKLIRVLLPSGWFYLADLVIFQDEKKVIG